MGNITIDGKLYDIETLPQEVTMQLAALQQCDKKIKSWNMDIAMAQTAVGVYRSELNRLLLEVEVVKV